MSDRPERYINVDNLTKIDFENALRRGFWRSIVSWLTRANNNLMPYDEVRRALPTSGEHYIGLHNIPTDKIVGSVGRYQDFDRAFLPVDNRMQGRWRRVDRAHLTNIELPPIEVYKLGEVYFVKDGNHRVSVARERGQVFIDAEVIEIDSPVPIDEHTDIDTLIRKVEKAEFLRETNLETLRPNVNIDLSLPGGYRILLEHIKVHRYFMGQNSDEVTWKDAVCGWVDQVYMPLVKVIRKNKILREFPGRTEADLYLWIIEHLWYLREEYRKDISMEEAAAHFAGEFTKRPLHRLINMIKRTPRFCPEPGSEE